MDCDPKAVIAGFDSSAPGPITVLLVEDQDMVRRFTSAVLEEEGYRVVQASSGAEALSIVADQSLDISLLITDIVMPRMSGAELVRRMEERRPNLRTLFISGSSSDYDVSADQPSAKRAFLPKPYAPEQLCHQVARMVNPAATAPKELCGIEPGRTMRGEPKPESSALDGVMRSNSIPADRDHEARESGTIVVADDDPEIRTFLCTILTSAGYQVLEAKNGKEAIRQVETSEADLVITDLAMPEQEGIETIQKLRGLQPQLKIIAMSGQFSPLLRMAQRLGAHESLSKPIGPDELLATVRRVITGW